MRALSASPLQILDVGSGSGYLTAILAHMVCRASPLPSDATAEERATTPTLPSGPRLGAISSESQPTNAESFPQSEAAAYQEGGLDARRERDSGGGRNGMVVGIEHIPELVKLATAAAEALPFARALLQNGRLRFVQVCPDSMESAWISCSLL